MSRTKTTFARRALASVGAAALGLMGVVGLSTSAMADPDQEPAPEFGMGNIVPGTPGSLTIHKYAGTEIFGQTGGTKQTITGKSPVAGVQFTIYPINGIDLTTDVGWTAVQGIYDSAFTCGPTASVPGHTLGTGIVMDYTEADGVSSETGLAIGAYLVCETDAPDVVTTRSAPFIVTVPMPNGASGWNYDIHAYPKNDLDEGEASKTVDNGTAVKQGDQVTWTVKSKNILGPLSSFVMTDTLDPNLSWLTPEDMDITAHKADGTTVVATGWFDIAGTGQTRTATANAGGLVELNKLPAGYYLTFVFNTTVNGPGILENSANVGGVDVDASTPWGLIQVKKQDSANQAVLSGAQFEVYAGACNPESGASVLETLTTDSNGIATSGALIDPTAGTTGTSYCLKETVAPPGFVLPADPYTTVVVKAGQTAETQTVTTINNTKASGPELPITGASGTMLMTIGGIGLVAVAGGLYLATRRKAHQE